MANLGKPVNLLKRGRPRKHSGCFVAGCTSPHNAKGYCKVHYARFMRTGDPLRLVQVYKVPRDTRPWGKLEPIDGTPEAVRKFKNSIRRLVHYAVRTGKIVKPSTCSDCGTGWLTLHAHHEDYSRPLEVKWICSACHGLRHRKSHE